MVLILIAVIYLYSHTIIEIHLEKDFFEKCFFHKKTTFCCKFEEKAKANKKQISVIKF